MKRSGVRVALAIVIILIIAGVAGLELKDAVATDDSFETQIRKLESYWPSRRRAAATELARYSGDADKVVPSLVKALGDSDTNVRLNALESLKSYGEKSKTAGPAARQMVTHDPDQTVRREAAALLGLIKDQDAVPLLVATLDDRNPAVRVEAIRSLGMFGRGIASGPLVDKMIWGLGPAQPVEVREVSLEALDSLAQRQERAARAIADVAAKDPSPDIRYRAVSYIRKPIFAFQVPALVAALDDPSPRVRLIAGNNLAAIGLSDDRVAPALCHAALTGDDATREGIGTSLDLLVLDRPADKTPDKLLTQRLETAVREFQTVLETRNAVAREHVINVLGKLIALYQSSGKPALLEPARAAVVAVLARLEDEKEEVPLRILALNQWTAIQLGRLVSSRRAASRPANLALTDELHAASLWMAAACRALKSSEADVRSRAGKILLDELKEADAVTSMREAWRKSVPLLAEVTRSEDATMRFGALEILTLLGPEAREALPALSSLAGHSPDPALKSAAERAIKSISSIDNLKAGDPAVRIAAAETLGQLGWRAMAALPSLFITLKDPESKVRAAAVNAVQALGKASGTAVAPLADALANETDPGVSTAILQALDAIAPGTPAVLDAHLMALRDRKPAVRKAGASFKTVPTDDSLVSALATALGDADDAVRKQAAGSLSEIAFANAAVVPALLRAMSDSPRGAAVVEALSDHLEHTSDAADFLRVRGDLPGLGAILKAAIPVLGEALSAKSEQTRTVVYRILGRIVAFSGLSRNEALRKGIEPALPLYLQGLDDSDSGVRAKVLSRLDAIPVGQAEIVAALKKFLGRSDRSAVEHQTALRVLKLLSDPTASKTNKGSGRGQLARVRIQ